MLTSRVGGCGRVCVSQDVHCTGELLRDVIPDVCKGTHRLVDDDQRHNRACQYPARTSPHVWFDVGLRGTVHQNLALVWVLCVRLVPSETLGYSKNRFPVHKEASVDALAMMCSATYLLNPDPRTPPTIPMSALASSASFLTYWVPEPSKHASDERHERWGKWWMGRPLRRFR